MAVEKMVKYTNKACSLVEQTNTSSEQADGRSSAGPRTCSPVPSVTSLLCENQGDESTARLGNRAAVGQTLLTLCLQCRPRGRPACRPGLRQTTQTILQHVSKGL